MDEVRPVVEAWQVIVGALGTGGIAATIGTISSHFLGKKRATNEMTATINDGFSALLTQQRGEMERVYDKMQKLEDSLERRNKLLDEAEQENRKLRVQIEEMKADMKLMKEEIQLLRSIIEKNGITIPELKEGERK